MAGESIPHVRILAIAGGSGSGKTTFARLLQEKLGSERCDILTQDHYYIDQSAKFLGDGENVNFDHPDALDFPLMLEHLRALKAGEPVEVPNYDFASHKRLARTTPLLPKPIILVDGILILSQPALREVFDESVFIDTHEEIRFERRFMRDLRERGRKAEGIRKQFFRQVKPMHDEFVEPSKAHASQVISGEKPFEPLLREWAARLRAGAQET